MRILLVEDERKLADALSYLLKKERYLVDVAMDGHTAIAFAESNLYELIILDWMLPGKDGLTVLKELRSKGVASSVLFLTAKDTVDNRTTGLDAGADDYLVKPFATKELLARVRALSRRPAVLVSETEVFFGNLTLHTQNLAVTVDSETIQLTSQEAHLLELFMRNPRQTLSKEQILAKVWGFDSEADVNSVELYVYYLRKKLKHKQAGCSIKTIRGAGYVLQEEKK